MGYPAEHRDLLRHTAESSRVAGSPTSATFLYQGDVITPTCNPALLAPNPANTYLNQLGCSISHGQATTPQTATSFLFMAGITGGLFSIPSDQCHQSRDWR